MERNARHTYPPAGYCIYCGTTEGELSDEHIVAYALSANLILPKASCIPCAKITQKIENLCLRGMFRPLRSRLRMQTRRKNERLLEVERRTIYTDGRSVTEIIPIEEFPIVCYGLKLPSAGILTGQPPTDSVDATHIFRFREGELENFAVRRDGITEIETFHPTAFLRLLAKIGYSYAAAELGTASLFPLLVDFIAGRANTMFYLIGGEEKELPRMQYGHRLELREYTTSGVVYVVVLIHLFGCMGMPIYHVVVSQKP